MRDMDQLLDELLRLRRTYRSQRGRLRELVDDALECLLNNWGLGFVDLAANASGVQGGRRKVLLQQIRQHLGNDWLLGEFQGHVWEQLGGLLERAPLFDSRRQVCYDLIAALGRAFDRLESRHRQETGYTKGYQFFSMNQDVHGGDDEGKDWKLENVLATRSNPLELRLLLIGLDKAVARWADRKVGQYGDRHLWEQVGSMWKQHVLTGLPLPELDRLDEHACTDQQLYGFFREIKREVKAELWPNLKLVDPREKRHNQGSDEAGLAPASDFMEAA